jgi:hypothetical protein
MRHLFVIGPAIMVVALWAASASAQESRATLCTARSAQLMTIAQIAADPEGNMGRCVAVEGLAVGQQLQAHNEARYRRPTRYNDLSSTGAIIGLYGNRLTQDRPQRALVIGVIDSCAAQLAAAERASTPESIIMIGGYCHTWGGLTIYAVTITALGDADQVRIPRGRADGALGDLAPMAAGPAREQLMMAATGLFAALGTVDVARALLRPSQGLLRGDEEVYAIMDRLANGAGTRSGSGVTEVFGWRMPLWAGAEERANYARQAEQLTEGIACHSSQPDAVALWPISVSDAFLGGHRPYACARISIDASGQAQFDFPGDVDEDYYIREP